MKKDLQATIQETVKEAVKEAIQEKKASLSEIPFYEQVKETTEEFSLFSSELLQLIWKFLVCFGLFFTLISSVKNLLKELRSPL